jgi:hypothetical protein
MRGRERRRWKRKKMISAVLSQTQTRLAEGEDWEAIKDVEEGEEAIEVEIEEEAPFDDFCSDDLTSVVDVVGDLATLLDMG